MTGGLLIRGVDLDGRVGDVELRDGRVHRVAATLEATAGITSVIDGGGGALIPGLHDHHLHLAALAASTESTVVGPPTVVTATDLSRALVDAGRGLREGEWLRAVGYHESVAGDIDRGRLDRIVPDRPVRVQHRSGARWTLNSAGLRATGADHSEQTGIERDDHGRPTGRLNRVDDWLRDRLPPSTFPDLSAVGRRLADLGVTGVTDCTPYRDVDGPIAIAAAMRLGQLSQRVVLTGHADLLHTRLPEPVEVGPVKIVIDEYDLPDLDSLVDTIRRVHAAERPVAIHLVTAAATAFALAAWIDAGSLPGDRIEHGALITSSMAQLVADLGLTVVTQPSFVAERGDQYLADVPAEEIDDLYRCASLGALGIAVAGSSDAPYADPDPWLAVRAATERRTASGRRLGGDERLDGRAALALFTGDPRCPGRGSIRVMPGAAADLCLLHVPLQDALARPRADHVRSVFRQGVPIGGTDE
jgi:predicted amidohydrolase YtcJ